MKIITLGELYQMNYQAETIEAMFQCWWENGSVFRYMSRPRHSHALMYLSHCSVEYFAEGCPVMNAPKGSVVYIPQGARYTCRFHGAKRGQESTVLVEFQLRDKEGQEIGLSREIMPMLPSNTAYFYHIFSELAQLYDVTLQCPALQKSLLYRLLAELSNVQRTRDMYARKFKNIAKGIRYLEQDPDQLLSIEEIAALCSVSSNCFRRLFKEYSGQTPSEYRLNVKMNRARQLLENGDIGVAEVAYVLGFDDPAYFSRLFRQKNGVSPSTYAQRLCREDGM